MTVMPELVNLANGSAQHGDRLAAKICRDAIAEIERLQSESEYRSRTIAHYQEVVADQNDRAGRLQAIVGKLPKCWRLDEAGELVQDVPVVPGMKLWVLWDNEVHEFVAVTVRACSDREFLECDTNMSKCYSTREAAEAGGK